jgi:preprotein translocase subunit SecB
MEVQSAPLQLEAYFIEALSMKTNPQFDPSVESYEGRITVEPQHLVNVGNEALHQLVLRVKYSPREGAEARLPYSIDVTGRGFFAFTEPDMTRERRVELLAFNGTSILYGLLRAEVAHVTALGVSGSMLLPAVNLAQSLADWARRERRRAARADVATVDAGTKQVKAEMHT